MSAPSFHASLATFRQHVRTFAIEPGEPALSTQACWAIPVARNAAITRVAVVAPPGNAPAAALGDLLARLHDAPTLAAIAYPPAHSAEEAEAALRGSAWTTRGVHALLALEAADVPLWDDLVHVADIRGVHQRKRAHAIVLDAAAAWAFDGADFEKMVKPASDGSAHTVYGAQIGGQMVSTVRAVRHENTCGLFLFATAPAWQRKGIGGAMLDNVLYLERERGAATIHMLVPSTVAGMLHAAGFRTVATILAADNR